MRQRISYYVNLSSKELHVLVTVNEERKCLPLVKGLSSGDNEYKLTYDGVILTGQMIAIARKLQDKNILTSLGNPNKKWYITYVGEESLRKRGKL